MKQYLGQLMMLKKREEGQNILFKIAANQYLECLMMYKGGIQNSLLKIAAKQCLGKL